MCIAIVKPVGKDIAKKILKRCSVKNPDGCGFAYINVDNEGVRRIKTKKAMGFDEFYEKYEKALELNPDSPFLIHFRIKTHGKIDLANCHPFKVDNEHVFIHNGTIKGVRSDEEMSDTRVFNVDMLRILPKGWNQNTGMKSLIEEFIGYSKIAVMDIAGEVNIYNEHKGEWNNEIWYSNKGYEKVKPYVPYVAPSRTTHTPWKSGSSTLSGGTGSITTHGAYTDLTKVKSRSPISNASRTYDIDTHIPCDYCSGYHKVDEMEAYWQGNGMICFCPRCAHQEDIWYHFEPEDLVSSLCHADWLTERGTEVGDDIAMYQVAGPWENPWAEPYADLMPSDYDEMTEMEQALADQYEEEQSLLTTNACLA